jgi:hypothetical protein
MKKAKKNSNCNDTKIKQEINCAIQELMASGDIPKVRGKKLTVTDGSEVRSMASKLAWSTRRFNDLLEDYSDLVDKYHDLKLSATLAKAK